MVYLVDDDVDDLEFVQEALVKNSYKGPVDTALNGQLLINKLTDQQRPVRPDVIVLDLNMPLKDGFQTLHEIKNNPALNRIPVIILTASSNKDDEMRCIALGCHAYFRKPDKIADYQSLVSTIKAHVRTQ
jgi:chemotaxis family two-component system response regulator Rcp1